MFVFKHARGTLINHLIKSPWHGASHACLQIRIITPTVSGVADPDTDPDPVEPVDPVHETFGTTHL